MKFNKLLLINYLITLFLEITFKIIVFKKVFSLDLFYLLIFSFFIALFITIILRILPNKISKILIHIIWAIISLLFIIELVYFKYYNTLVGISGLEYTSQVMQFKSSIIQVVLGNLHYIVLLLIPNIILICIRKVDLYEKFKKKEAIITLLASLTILLITGLTLFIKDNTNKDILINKNNILLSTNRFGLVSGVNLDIIKKITNFKENTNIINIEETQKQIQEKEYNITNIDFDKLNENETNETIKSMHNYFKNSLPTNKNKYTGLFKDKNLIFIVAEAFYPLAINEELTPTLYKMSQQGFNFINFYQPIYGCSTSDGEFTSLYSLLPGAATCTMKITSNNYYPYSIGKIFPNYKTTAFHGGSYKYYSRHKTLPNLGFDFYGCGNGLNINCKSWPQSDFEVVQDSLKYFIQEENFVTYYMSISGHLEYNFYGNLIAKKNKTLVENLEASDAIKAYMATQIEFDRSLELLITELKKSGKLEDTVIAIVPDHYPYGLEESEITNYTNIKDTTYELYKNSFILWNSEMKEPIKIDKYASNIDVLPTILNLFGIEYDSRLLIGKDILSDSEGIVMFNNYNWINEYGKYNYLTKTFTPNQNKNLTEEEINTINTIIQNKFSISKLIIEEDYYNKVFKQSE